MRVVQIEPGPMPTLMASAPASISALAPSPVATLPAMIATLLDCRLSRADLIEHLLRMAVRGVDDDAVDAGFHQHHGPLEALVADAGGRRDAQPPLGILAGVRVQRRFLHVLDGEQADAAPVLVDHDQLFDPVLMQQPARIVRPDALAHGDDLLGHQFADGLARDHPRNERRDW